MAAWQLRMWSRKHRLSRIDGGRGIGAISVTSVERHRRRRTQRLLPRFGQRPRARSARAELTPGSSARITSPASTAGPLAAVVSKSYPPHRDTVFDYDHHRRRNRGRRPGGRLDASRVQRRLRWRLPGRRRWHPAGRARPRHRHRRVVAARPAADGSVDDLDGIPTTRSEAVTATPAEHAERRHRDRPRRAAVARPGSDGRIAGRRRCRTRAGNATASSADDRSARSSSGSGR